MYRITIISFAHRKYVHEFVWGLKVVEVVKS